MLAIPEARVAIKRDSGRFLLYVLLLLAIGELSKEDLRTFARTLGKVLLVSGTEADADRIHLI